MRIWKNELRMDFLLLLLSVSVNSKVCVFHCCSLGVDIKNGFPVERKRSYSLHSRCNELIRLGILAMFATCQVNNKLWWKRFSSGLDHPELLYSYQW